MPETEWIPLQDVLAAADEVGLPEPTQTQLHRWAKAKLIERRQARAPGQIGSAPTEYAAWAVEVILALLADGRQRNLERRVALHWLRTGHVPPNQDVRALLAEGCRPATDALAKAVAKAGSVESAHKAAMEAARKGSLGRIVMRTAHGSQFMHLIGWAVLGGDLERADALYLHAIYRLIYRFTPAAEVAVRQFRSGALSFARYPQLIATLDDESIETGRQFAAWAYEKVHEVLSDLARESRIPLGKIIVGLVGSAVMKANDAWPFLMATLGAIITQTERNIHPSAQPTAPTPIAAEQPQTTI